MTPQKLKFADTKRIVQGIVLSRESKIYKKIVPIYKDGNS